MNGWLFHQQVLDFVSMNTARRQFSNQKREGGWYRIAWAFLKVQCSVSRTQTCLCHVYMQEGQNCASINPKIKG